MPAYLLVPLHTGQSVWQIATRRDPLQVIAKSEQKARMSASLQFGPASKGVSVDAAADPWLNSRWVYAHVIEEVDPKMLTLSETR